MRVVLEGECTVARVVDIKRMLLEALDSGQPVALDLQGVTRIDLAFCQLIHALFASCRERGVACSQATGMLPEVAVIAERCGLPGLDKAGAP